MNGVICGHPTAKGPCRRPVRAPGAPCGAAHPAPAPTAGMPPTGTPAPGDDPLRSLQHDAAADPRTPPDELDRLAYSPGWVVRSNVAANPSARPDTLVRLAADTNPGVQASVANNSNIPHAAAAELLGRPATHIRAVENLAGNPATPSSILAHLAADTRPAVAWRLAGNPATPSSILAHLAEDPRPAVRQQAAGNPNTPPPARAHAGLLAD